jgi:hypothetical protein
VAACLAGVSGLHAKAAMARFQDEFRHLFVHGALPTTRSRPKSYMESGVVRRARHLSQCARDWTACHRNAQFTIVRL